MNILLTTSLLKYIQAKNEGTFQRAFLTVSFLLIQRQPQPEFKSKDAIVDNALSWGIVLWSLDGSITQIQYV